MKPISTLTDFQLTFHSTDCEQAIKANPRNPKAAQYLAEMHACERELLRRETIRARRRFMVALIDPLTVPVRYRWRARCNHNARFEARAAARSLAFLTDCRP